MNKVNLLSLNVCNLKDCNCGANVTLGTSKEVMTILLNVIDNLFGIESMLPDSCPNCNCSEGFIMPSDPFEKKIKEKAFCFECQEFVKLVPAGTGKVFRKHIQQSKKQEAKASALYSKKEQVKND